MSHPFPQETIDLLAQRLIKYMSDAKKVKPVRAFASIINHYTKDEHYNFRENLRSGEYALYNHEMGQKDIPGFNCTTIIPTLYIFAELLGFKPQIVQFSGIRNVRKESDKEEPKDNATHFAIIADTDRGYSVLADPFHDIYGRIIKFDTGSITLANNYGFKKVERQFDKLDYFSPENFTQMMSNLKTDAGSLDMLISGQKVNSGILYQNIDCRQHVYFEEDPLAIKTRLYVPRKMISDMAIILTQGMNQNGEKTTEHIDLYLAKDSLWKDLVDPKHIARVELKNLLYIKEGIKKIYNPKKDGRIGRKLQSSDLLKEINPITEEVNPLSAIRQVLARSLYETESPEKLYLFSADEHDKFLFNMREEFLEKEKITDNKNKDFWLANWKWVESDKTKRRILRREKSQAEQESNKISNNIGFLNSLRYHHRPEFSSLVDRLICSKKFESASNEDLAYEANKRGIDLRVGQAAIISEFIPFVIEAKDELWLKQFMPHIERKIKARYSAL